MPKVQEELHELVTLHLDGLEEVGECKRFFDEHQIEIQWQKVDDEVTLRVPYPDLVYNSGPPIKVAPLLQPHMFPFPQPTDTELATAGA